MRLSLLALGLLAGAPDMSCGLNSDPEATLMVIGYSLALKTKETRQAVPSLLEPSAPPSSFFELSRARRGLHQLQKALQAARLSITQRLARGQTSAAEQTVHGIGLGPAQEGAQRRAPTSGRHFFVMPGDALPRLAGQPDRATPAARLLIRRGALPHPLAAFKPQHGVGEMEGQITSTLAPGTIFSRYSRTLAGTAALEEPFMEELSQEVLKATEKARLKKEAGFKEQIVEVMQANIADIERRKKAAGVRTEFLPVERLCMTALTYMTGAREGTEEVILRNIRELTTDKQLLAECLARQIKILRVGGMGVVIEAEILDEACEDALGMDKLAVKVMYADLKGGQISQEEVQAVYQRLESRYEAETQPLKLIGTAAKPGQSFKEMLKEKHWAVPGYSASAGQSGQAYIHKRFLFNPHLLLSELMLGDGLKLLHFRGFFPGARVPMPVREYICGEMIRSTAKLHELGLAHYDIKADNILLGRDGSVNLADFGMCGPINTPKLCADGVTPLYADPDQVSCLQKGGLLSMNPQYDSWSLGMTCYLIMTTRGFPYKIRNNAGMLDHISSLVARSVFRSRMRHGNPEQELKDAGASHMERVTSLISHEQRQKWWRHQEGKWEKQQQASSAVKAAAAAAAGAAAPAPGSTAAIAAAAAAAAASERA
ncbi:hypothetical protein Esti_006544 [Eimeria stiedai]